MYSFLLVVDIIVAIALVGVILMQRSEGGGLVGGGSSSGLMTARGAADLLTRTTTILATIFVALSIAMAAVATMGNKSTTIDTSLAKPVTPAAAPAPAPVVPLAGDSNASVPMAATPAPVVKQEAPKAKVTRVDPKPVTPRAAEKTPAPVIVTPTVTPPAGNVTQ